MKLFSYSLLFILIVCLTGLHDPEDNDGSLYVLDLENPSLYDVSCYFQLNSKWVVCNDSCCLTTSVINIPGNSESDPNFDIPINISLNKTGNLDVDDFVRIEYTTGEDYTEIFKLNGTELENGLNVYPVIIENISAGSDIQIRIIMKTNERNEKISMHQNGDNQFKVGTPFITGTDELFDFSLPVELMFFNAQLTDNTVLLEWTTASEINNDYFEIEKSTDGISFSTISIVQGNGTSNSQNVYKEYDDMSISGTIYYRLKQVDYDGKYQYYDMISVNKESATSDCKFRIQPNPCIGRCTVMLDDCAKENNDNIEFYIYDAMGNAILASGPKSINNGQAKFSFSSSNKIQPGMYIVRGKTTDTEIEDKIMINNQ